jgi:chromate reductase, NAD(P)H dehydrogenase (quinone)
MPQPIHILGLAGSLRQKSFNHALLLAASKLAPAGVNLQIHDIADIPLFNQDVEALGYPAAVQRLHAAVSAADAILIATPEYNHGIPGVLKNVLDWMSRPSGKSTAAGKPVAVIGTSTGVSGSMRAQLVLRPVLAGMGMPQLLGADCVVPNAPSAFDANLQLVDERAIATLTKTMAKLPLWIDQLRRPSV